VPAERKSRFLRLFGVGLVGLEFAAAALLILLGVLAILGLLMEVPNFLRPPFLGGEKLWRVLDKVLAVFILIELTATAVSYVRGHDVLHRILEASIVAVARKLILLDLSTTPLSKAGAVSLLLVAITIAWGILVRTDAMRSREDEDCAA
jgi:uncharacterized membrane protein (DUF373 family)